MENTKQATVPASVLAQIKELGIILPILELELTQHEEPKPVNEPKDGEWYELNMKPEKFIIKFKSRRNKDSYNYHIGIFDDGNLKKDDWCRFIETARKITPKEALPYIEKWAEKAGLKEGTKYKSSAGDNIFIFEYVRVGEIYPWCFYGGENGCLFDNNTNTFATLVEEKVEPLELDGCKAIAYKEKVVIYFENDDVTFTHSEIEQIYKLSLKAQGK